jgi:hypothetical protein
MHILFYLFDAETKEAITYNDHTFYFKPNGTKDGIHELATALATIAIRLFTRL